MNTLDNDIDNQINLITNHLKKHPMDLDARLLLIQLWCLNADWQKALSTTEGFLKIHTDNHVQSLLKNNILAEIHRQQAFASAELPYTYNNYKFNSLQLNLFQKFNKHNYNLLSKDFEILIDTIKARGTITTYQERFQEQLWIDSDFRLSSILEIFIQDNYYWLPMNAILSIKFWQHEILTDILWRRAQISLQDNTQIAAFVPARYPIISNCPHNIKMNKTTQWDEVMGLAYAQGQKVLTSGEQDVAILDIDKIEFAKIIL